MRSKMFPNQYKYIRVGILRTQIKSCNPRVLIKWYGYNAIYNSEETFFCLSDIFLAEPKLVILSKIIAKNY